MTLTERIEHIEKVCTDYYGLTLDEVKSNSRCKNIILCRFMIWWYLYQLGLTQKEIANRYGRLTSTISHANRKTKRIATTDKAILQVGKTLGL